MAHKVMIRQITHPSINKKKLKMILKLVPPLPPPVADKIPSLCCHEKSKQPETTWKIFLSGVSLMREGGEKTFTSFLFISLEKQL